MNTVFRASNNDFYYRKPELFICVHRRAFHW